MYTAILILLMNL